jgi:hypothetical protein
MILESDSVELVAYWEGLLQVEDLVVSTLP